jgi:dTDP-4-dehydrorhamnose reductase
VRLLVTGAGGLLGGRLAALLSASHEVVAARHLEPPPAGLAEVPFDLSSLRSMETALDKARPDAVLHAAALADVDRCEREPDLAERINVAGSEGLARLCGRRGIRLIAISTDLVFAGDLSFVKETDPAAAPLVYSRTKRLGEDAVLAEAPGAAVLRVALVHGRGYGRRATATESIAWALTSGRTVRLYTDQYRTPVDAESVADLVARLIERGGGGHYHAGGPERLSRHALGMRVASVLGLATERIEPVSQAEAAPFVRRPADCSLDSRRAHRELGWTARPLDVGIREGRLSGPAGES